jgi:DNA polymerase-3 subunit delta'
LPVPCGSCRTCRNIFALNFEGLQFALPIPSHNKPEEAIDLMNEVLGIKRQEPFAVLSSAVPTNIPVSIARDIKRNLSLRASTGVTRVVVFYQMEKMKTSSADALLKLIEEPPSDTVIVLISQKPDSLLPTIQSRSQRVKIDRLAAGVVERYLIERYEIDETRARLAARIGEGSIGRALASVEADEAEGADRSGLFLLFKSLFRDSAAETLAAMDEMLNFRDRSEAEKVLQLWQMLIRDCSGYAVSSSEEELVNVDFAAEIEKLAPYFGSSKLAAAMLGDIKITLADLRRNVHIQGALMALALRLKRDIEAVRAGTLA